MSGNFLVRNTNKQNFCLFGIKTSREASNLLGRDTTLDHLTAPVCVAAINALATRCILGKTHALPTCPVLQKVHGGW